MSVPDIPGQVYDSESGGYLHTEQERREWWRWHFAGQLVGPLLTSLSAAAMNHTATRSDLKLLAKSAKTIYEAAVTHADNLIHELEGGE